MSDIVSDAKASPAVVKAKRLPPGVHNDIFIDQVGVAYHQVEDNVTPDAARQFVAAGGQVVFDECGCGGTCGLRFSATEDRASLTRKSPILESHKGQTGSVSIWQSDSGKRVLPAQGPVRW
ncbi:MAG: hypothetical protein F2621_06215 [Actinobacteria bacterium]|uniref:Unannotated protein n=1 Tax=freshwater metagenome TaxID=449393 RepID=A0A6J6EJN1_9ZZZZ|nr:hypothetical protein [Actinomycetota bacterium]MTA33279.1 hypothetical protein [Actinomycetota bacterium]